METAKISQLYDLGETIAAGEDIYCIRSDGDGWMYVRAKDGTEGFLPVTQM